MHTDYLIIGAGILGLTTAYYLQKKYPDKSILIIEKETNIAQHASGRNSGVLHAGLYYATDSLRAKYCSLGAAKIREYSLHHNIQLSQCGKVIVAQNENEIFQIKDLYRKALNNGIRVSLINEKELGEIEKTAKTCEIALYSPDTASFNAKAICKQLQDDLVAAGVKFSYATKHLKLVNNNEIITNQGNINFAKLINCAGMYADKIAQDFGLVEDYTLIPFKGIFLYCNDLSGNYQRHIYPVPNQKLKLLGVHFSPEYDGKIKLGPTAIPCLARENYRWLENWRFNEMKEVLSTELKLLISNKFNFRDLAIAEFKKQTKTGLINSAARLVHNINQFQFTHWGTPGIQPRLYNIKKSEIMDDFLIATTPTSVHLVNSVSPAFTAAFAFSENLVQNYL
jgi:L-2-hydroxyglutarate oxidase LhgO